jgi:hypothetical protein
MAIVLVMGQKIGGKDEKLCKKDVVFCEKMPNLCMLKVIGDEQKFQRVIFDMLNRIFCLRLFLLPLLNLLQAL